MLHLKRERLERSQSVQSLILPFIPPLSNPLLPAAFSIFFFFIECARANQRQWRDDHRSISSATHSSPYAAMQAELKGDIVHSGT